MTNNEVTPDALRLWEGVYTNKEVQFKFGPREVELRYSPTVVAPHL